MQVLWTPPLDPLLHQGTTPFDLRTVADKEKPVDPSVKLKQQHSAAALQTQIHLLVKPGNVERILWDSLLVHWMTEPVDKKN